MQHEWKKMVDIWTGAVLVGSVGCFHIFRKLGNGKPTCVTIARPPDVSLAAYVQLVLC